jgi:electron transfer flavoprotein alpha subunit
VSGVAVSGVAVSGAGRPDAGRPVAVVVARDGRLPAGADETVAEAGGLAVVVGSGAERAAGALAGARTAWWAEVGDGFAPARLAATLAPVLADAPLVVLPASPDGRDLGPRLAAALDRPLIAQALEVVHRPGGGPDVTAVVARLDDRVLVPVAVDGAAVATLVPGARGSRVGRDPATGTPEPHPSGSGARDLRPLSLGSGSGDVDGTPNGGTLDGAPDPELVALVEPDPATMDLGDATRVLGGGAGLAAGGDDARARETFDLLARVATALGASAGATRVATDAGWIGYERQIGTTGVSVDPDLYLALGVSGASQHLGGLGAPRHVVSVNLDPSCPMTAMADLGLVTDARALLEELGRRLGVGDSAGDPAAAGDPDSAGDPAAAVGDPDSAGDPAAAVGDPEAHRG